MHVVRRVSETDANTFAGNAPQGICVVRRMSETGITHQPTSQLQFNNLDARTMNTKPSGLTPTISGTPMYPVHPPVELPPPQGMMVNNGYTLDDLPPSYESAVSFLIILVDCSTLMLFNYSTYSYTHTSTCMFKVHTHIQ